MRKKGLVSANRSYTWSIRCYRKRQVYSSQNQG